MSDSLIDPQLLLEVNRIMRAKQRASDRRAHHAGEPAEDRTRDQWLLEIVERVLGVDRDPVDPEQLRNAAAYLRNDYGKRGEAPNLHAIDNATLDRLAAAIRSSREEA